MMASVTDISQLDQSDEQPRRVYGPRLGGLPKIAAIGLWATIWLTCLCVFFLAIHIWFLWDNTPASELPRFFPDMLPKDVQARGDYQQAIYQIGLTLPLYAYYFVVMRLLSGIPYFVLSFLIVHRRSDRLMAVLFAIVLAVGGAAGRWLETNWRPVPGLYPWMAIPVKLLFLILDCSLILFFTFPDGRFVPRWTRWIALYVVIYYLLKNFAGNSPINPDTYPGLLRVLSDGILVAIGIFAMIYRYRRDANAVQKQQLKWFVVGTVLLGILFLEEYFTTIFYFALTGHALFHTPMQQLINELITEPGWYVAQFLWAVCIGIAVFRYHLWDIDLVINRVLVYGSLTALTMGVYLTTVAILGSVFRGIEDPVIFFLATGLVAILFEPLRQRLQRLINRWMYGKRDDPYAVLTQLSNALEHTPSPSNVLPAIAKTIKEALKIPYVAIEIEQNGTYHQVAIEGSSNENISTFPLIDQGETIGRLQVAFRARGEVFSKTDQQLLKNIARQAGSAAHAVRLNAALLHSRAQIITTREEERRRLRRDLHDGLGPILAGQTLKLGAVKQLVNQDSKKACSMIDEMIHQNENTIAEVRRLVYDLRPPALDELGLVEALRDVVHQAEGTTSGMEIHIEGPDEGLPKLPAAVEVNAYRIAAEALTNAVRHSKGQRCTVRFLLNERDDFPIMHGVEIADDGTGIPDHYRAGVGLRSMRERAEEIGGRLQISPKEPKGTLITAWLPLSIE